MLVNYAQRLFEAVLFFHPAVWYVSRVISVEREICCDDMVLSQCRREDYASALVSLAESYTASGGSLSTAALAATGGRPSQLKRRVMRILELPPATRSARSGLGALLIMGVVLAATGLSSSRSDSSIGRSTGKRFTIRRGHRSH